MFFINQPSFLQKKSFYLFGIRICIWAAKNYEFSHRVSVVRDSNHELERSSFYYALGKCNLTPTKGAVSLDRYRVELESRVMHS